MHDLVLSELKSYVVDVCQITTITILLFLKVD